MTCLNCFNETLPFNQLDDVEFSLALFELANGAVHFTEDRLLSLKFNPLLSRPHRPIALSADLDPDLNFISDSKESDYYTEDQFNDQLQKSKFNSHCLSFLHLNIRSLSRNIDNLTNMMAKINIKFSVIGISETWLQETSHSVDMDGYKFVHNNRSGRTGGGVGLYLTSKLVYKIRDDLKFSDQQCAESLFIEICRPKEKNIIVGIIYRPPNQNPCDFMSDLDYLLSKVSKENKLCHMLGDFNLNLMNLDCHQPTSEFLDLTYSNMFYPLITRPTRITSNTATLIDNIFTNNLNNVMLNGLLFTDISDHLPVFSIFRDQCNDSNKITDIIYRDKSESNVLKFQNELRNFSWSNLRGYNDPSQAYDSFLKEYTAIYNLCFPLKKQKARKCTVNKPWLSKGLLKSIGKKNKLYRRYLRNPSPQNEQKYKKYKNKLTHSLRIAKRLWYEKKLENAKSNMKSTWRILNEIINRKTQKNRLPSTFKIDNCEVSNPEEIANRFCEYFTNIGPNLAKTIPASTNSHRFYLKGKFIDSVFLETVTQQEIVDLINDLRSGTAAGFGTIPVSIVKHSIGQISEPLTHIINLSIQSGIVPDRTSENCSCNPNI